MEKFLGKKKNDHKKKDNKKIKTESNKSIKDLPYFINKTEDAMLLRIKNETEIKPKKILLINDEIYKNFIDEKTFNEKLEVATDDIINLDKYYFFKKEIFCKYHLKEYFYIDFKICYLEEFINLKNFCALKETQKILEIFIMKGTGISTYFFVTFSNLRKKGLIPFIIFDLNIIERFTDSQDLMNYIYFSIMNLFIDYKSYNNFCAKIFSKLKKNKYSAEEIIIKIIKNYLKVKKVISFEYNPCIIIDGYYESYNYLNENLQNLQKKYNFSLIFIYNIEKKQSNQIFLNYRLIGFNIDKNKILVYLNNLYGGLCSLPNKFAEYFNQFYPSITNYIRINNLNDENGKKQYYEEEKESIKKSILEFYNNEELLMKMYLNSIFILVNKKLNINHEYIQNIILNLPLNYFAMDIIGSNIIKIKYRSKIAKKVFKKLCKEYIIDLLFNLNEFNFEKFIKGGIFELGIRQLILKGYSIFGKIEKNVKFNCILNTFKTKDDYAFTEEEIEEKMKTLKSVKDLKEKYENFEFENNFIIKQNNNGKNFDLAIVTRYEYNGEKRIRLYLLQISINKKIGDIKNILAFLDNKIKFIKRKLLEILGIQIDDVHFLLIFQHSMTKSDTLSFCLKYKIPFIFYNNNIHKFITKNLEEINYEKLLKETSFNNNYKFWKNSLNDEYCLIEEDDNCDLATEDIINSDLEDNDIYNADDKKFFNDDIINNKNFSKEYFQ